MNSEQSVPSVQEITKVVTQLAEMEEGSAAHGLPDPQAQRCIADWQRELPDIAAPVKPAANC
jgi:hypothetical protein